MQTKTPTRKVPMTVMRGRLRRRIRSYERRYEMPSSQMLAMMAEGRLRETAEMLKWMQDYHALRLVSQTHTNGTPMSNTD